MKKPLKSTNHQERTSRLFLTSLSFLASKLNKLQMIYEEQEVRLTKEYSDPNSIPFHYKYLETQASRLEFDELVKYLSEFHINSKLIDAKTKRKQKSDSHVFKTSVSHYFNLKDLNKEKITQQAADLCWFDLLRLNLNKLLLVTFLVPIFLGVGVEVKSSYDSMLKSYSIQDTNVSISARTSEYITGGLKGLGTGVLVDFFLLYILLMLPETLFLELKIRIKEADKIKLPELKHTFLKLQALNLNPFVEFDFSEDRLDVSLFLDLSKINLQNT
jgi:hypothetical protein